VTGTGSLNLRFPGQYNDAESGLNYNFFRDYNPAIGRYVEADPIGIERGKNHLYGFTDNNPVNRIDPEGKWWQIPATVVVVGGGLYLFKKCMDKCFGKKELCPTEGSSRKRFGQCAEYCTSLSVLWLTITDSGFANTTPRPFPGPISTSETIGAGVND